MRRLRLCLTMIAATCGFASTAQSQSFSDEYYPYYDQTQEQSTPEISSDSRLFYSVLGQEVLPKQSWESYYTRHVAFSGRGAKYSSQGVALDGIRMGYKHNTLLRALGYTPQSISRGAIDPQAIAPTAPISAYDSEHYNPKRFTRIALFATNAEYIGGFRISGAYTGSKGWSGGFAASGRFGNDLHTTGVFTNRVEAAFSLHKLFGSRTRLSFYGSVSPECRGLLSTTSAEAVTLTRDTRYNAAWGYQNGKVRNSRISRGLSPLLAASLWHEISAKTQLRVSLAGEYSLRKTSSLGWYDASTPLPDNYRKMPSHFDSDEASIVGDAWRRSDSRYTQIDWQRLYLCNSLCAEQGAKYAVEDRVESLYRVSSNASIEHIIAREQTLHVGVEANYSSRCKYKQMNDLLGADYLLDVDYFLADDHTYSNNKQNDLRHPNRHITEGEVFGYKYRILNQSASLYLAYNYVGSRWSIDLGSKLGFERTQRVGLFEKELFRGDKSLGRSQNADFVSYTLAATCRYFIALRHRLSIAAAHCADAPQSEYDLFLNPQYNNRLVDAVEPQLTTALDATYSYLGEKVDLSVAAFYSITQHENRVVRYFDDLSGSYVDMFARGISTARYGIEAVCEYRPNPRWSITAMGCAGRYVYCNTPSVDIYSDADNSIIAADTKSYMSGCIVGNAPQYMAVADAQYRSKSRWTLGASVNFFGGRYAEPSLVYRMPRVANQASNSIDDWRLFSSQENLGSALSLDVVVGKGIRLKRGVDSAPQLYIFLTIRNLLNHTDTAYSGFEQNRLVRHTTTEGVTTYRPMASRYIYTRPISIYLSASVRL